MRRRLRAQSRHRAFVLAEVIRKIKKSRPLPQAVLTGLTFVLQTLEKLKLEAWVALSRLCRLMCGKAMPFREHSFLIQRGYASQRGIAPRFHEAYSGRS